MRKLIALFMLAGIMFVPVFANAQDASADSAAATEATPAVETPAESPTVVDDEIVAEEQSFHQVLKEKFIEGDPLYMTPVLLCLILGLAIALERIITLNLATTNSKKLLTKIEDALAKVLNDEVPFYTPWIRQTYNVVSKKVGGTFALYPNDRDSTMGITGWTIAAK